MTRRIWLALTLALLATLLPLPPAHALPAADGFADVAFERLWMRVDGPVAEGDAGRSWTWGQRAGDRRYERYAEAPGGARLVQYFDKARMEIGDPAADRAAPWFVSNGLLVVELITGRVQLGHGTFEAREAAAVPVAGDPENNTQAPTYAMLRSIATIDGGGRAAPRLGGRVDATFGPNGVGSRPDLATPGTELVAYDQVTGHNIPRIFQEFMTLEGPIIEDGRSGRGQVVDALFAFGRPLTEPYWSRVRVGGVERDVLFQAFERRVLTFTPANPDPWKVEMGNVGQQYIRWRYGATLRYAQPPLPGGVSTSETSITLPTYDYERALVATSPGDPIYPYPRLDRARVGPPQQRAYRAVIVENRFLELTFLPQLGGRLYRAVDKATGQNIFYQNPVVKPSTFGQRGWWLGVGGLEWAAPTQEHGYLEYLPWDFSLITGEGVTARATTTERQSGMTVAGIVSLHANTGRFSVMLDVHNPTSVAHPLQMWTNAALSPGGANDVGPGVRLVAPTDSVIVHATDDAAIPGPHSVISWPRYQGRDISRPATWSGYIGVFAPAPVPFIGAYDTQRDAGAAVIHGPGASGGKLFSFGPAFDRSLYTDDQSEYLELWSGAQPTFWDDPLLAPGASRSISTAWLPLHGLGDLAAASDAGALGITRRPDGGLTVAIAAAQVSSGPVSVQLDGREAFRTAALPLRPDLPLAIDLPPGLSGSRIRVQAPGITLESSVPPAP